MEIAANANPPVVKIIDWGKFQYQKMKEEAKNRKKAREKQSELKQMKIGLKISDNDLNIKVRKMRGFLDDGDRVKIMIVFRGREMAHKELGNELLNKVVCDRRKNATEWTELVCTGSEKITRLGTKKVFSYFS